jgi:DNA-binding NarL/FixJ family response regulator
MHATAHRHPQRPILGEVGGFIARIHAPPQELGARCALATLRWTLTPRQSEVLACLADGMANAAIAATLGVALRTVEFHITALFDAAGVETRSALVASLLTMG